MTREEVIEAYESAVFSSGLSAAAENEEAARDYELLKAGLDALRGPTREQVEKVYPACDVCGGGKEIRSDNFCGMARLRIVGDSINLRGDEKKIKFFGHIYAPNFSVRFCPFCMAPMTDEAVEIMIERLNGIK